MIRNYFLAVIAVLVAVGIQDNLPMSMSIYGAKPDLTLVVLVAFSLASNPEVGAMLGFMTGLIHGSSVGISLGSFIVTRTITGFLAGFVNTRLFSDNFIVPIVSTAWLTVVCEGLFFIANPRLPIAYSIWLILGECIYNSILTLIVWAVLRHFEANRKIKLVNARL